MIRFDIFTKERLRDSYGEIGLLLEEHLKRLLLTITARNAAFVRDNILRWTDNNGTVRGDVALYNQLIDSASTKQYDEKMILSYNALCELFQKHPGTRIDESEIQTVSIDLQRLVTHMDVQSLNKALKQTSYSRHCRKRKNPRFKEQGDTVRDVFERFKDFRNQVLGHDVQATSPEETLNVLEALRDAIGSRTVKDAFLNFYLNGSDTVKDLEALCADLSSLIDDIRLYLEGFHMEQDSDERYDRRHLYKYTVVADEWAFQSKYVPFLTQDLLSCNTLNVFDTTVQALNGIRQKALENGGLAERISITADESAACKTALRELKKHIEDQDGRVKIRISFTDETGTPCDTWENIFVLLDHAPDQQICVVTDFHSESYAKQLIARGNPNHVVVYLDGPHTVRPARPQNVSLSFSFVDKDENGIKPSPSSSLSDLPQQDMPQPDLRQSKTDVHTVRAHDAASTGGSFTQQNASAQAARVDAPRSLELDGEDFSVPELLVIPKGGDTVAFDQAGRRTARLGENLGGGAEGDIYTTIEFNSYVVKIYKEAQLTPDRLRKLTKMIEFYRKTADKKLFRGICWPVFPVYFFDNLVGYAMERVPGGYTLEDILAVLQSQDLPESFPSVKRSDLLMICEQIIEVFLRLHSLSCENMPILMGDVNPKNIMVTKEVGHWNIWLVDVDSYQFGSEPCPVGRPEYFSLRIARELGNRSASSLRELPREKLDEKAAIATLLFYTLMIRQLPYSATSDQSYLESIRQRSFVFADKNASQTRHNYIWQNLTHEIRSLFQEAFGGGKGKAMRYPELEEWHDELHRQRSEIQDSKRSSDEIFPTSSLRGPDDAFIYIQCRMCRKSFEISKETRRLDNEADYNAESDLCPNCKNVRSYSQAEILSRICEVCGRPFTISKWDFRDNTKCPDCDPDFVFSRRNEFSDPDTFSKKLRQKVVDAVNNYLLSEE